MAAAEYCISAATIAALNSKPVSNSVRLIALRGLLHTTGLSAFIVPSADAHQSEYVADCDKRRGYISGFDGSAGVAVVTQNHALLWTDARYFNQAGIQLSKEWTLMKQGMPDVPSVDDWLAKNLASGSKVGVDASLYSITQFQSLSSALNKASIEVECVARNLVDIVWETEGTRPAAKAAPVFVHEMKYAGQSTPDKIAMLRGQMASQKVDVLVVAALDEVAWLFNLRGGDVLFNPVFTAYALLTADHVSIYVNATKLTEGAKQALHAAHASVHPYEQVFDDLHRLASPNKKIWMDPAQCSTALFRQIDPANHHSQQSPIALPKAKKNAAEIEGMRQAHLRDAAACIRYFAWLEQQLTQGGPALTEVTAADKLEWFRAQQADFVGLSFETISASGPNGAIIHYGPKPETCAPVIANQMYLCDSGGQYRDGTTDITRTLHFGAPSDFEKECYTRVLKGVIGLSRAVFPPTVAGPGLDVLARGPLWSAGLDYRHGTGHGVGAFLNVHEGPHGISSTIRKSIIDTALAPGMTTSNEPGYYEDGKFGIRIENVMVVQKVPTAYKFDNRDYLGFETITLVPMDRNLIVPQLLSGDELKWLNEYHALCVAKVTPLLAAQNDELAIAWLNKHAAAL